jgi:AraC-like DNA-binding protein
MAPALPAVCCTVAVSPLLRELIAKAAAFPTLTVLHGAQERLVATLLDELAAAPVEDLHLPIPRDARLRRLAALRWRSRPTKHAGRVGRPHRHERAQHDPAVAAGNGHERGPLARQLHVILALQRLAQGHSVKAVALELGYENTSGFVTMFRKAVGKPPARYLAERESGHKKAAYAAFVLHRRRKSAFARQGQEFRAQRQVRLHLAQHGRGDGFFARRADAAAFHAQVAAAHDHAHRFRFQHFHQRIGDLHGHAFLHCRRLEKQSTRRVSFDRPTILPFGT